MLVMSIYNTTLPSIGETGGRRRRDHWGRVEKLSVELIGVSHEPYG
jgi:hypothetical protein